MSEDSGAGTWAPYDLLGDPVPANFGRRGRPPHVATAENRQKVRLLLAFDWTNARIAKALRITGKTLRKHYFRELRQRDEARPALEANARMMLYKSAAGGNVAAMKELLRLIEQHDLARPRPPPRRPEPEAKPEKLGKKAAAELAARTAHEETGWDTLLN